MERKAVLLSDEEIQFLIQVLNYYYNSEADDMMEYLRTYLPNQER